MPFIDSSNRACSEDVKLLLKTAAGEIRTRGWCQGVLQAADGRVCAIGALKKAAHVLALDRQRALEMQKDVHLAVRVCEETLTREEPLLQQSPPCEVALSRWNDHRGRTAAEVIDLLERAAGSA